MKRPTHTNIPFPTLEDAFLVYKKSVGADEARRILTHAAKAVNISLDTDKKADLEKLFKHLSEKPDLIGVYGMSLYVRMMTHINLNKMQNKPTRWH